MKSRRMKISSWLVVTFIMYLIPVTASAELGRTIGATDTLLPGQGDIQTSLSTGYETLDSSTYFTESYLYLRYGITNDLSVAVVPSFYGWHEDDYGAESGISDTGIIGTYRFQNEEASGGYNLAIRSVTTVPTGDDNRGITYGQVRTSIGLLASKDFAGFVGVANLSYHRNFDTYDGQKSDFLSTSLEAVMPVNDLVSLNMNLRGNTHGWDESDHEIYSSLGLGVRYTPNKKSFVTLGAYKSLASRSYEWYYIIGVGYEF